MRAWSCALLSSPRLASGRPASPPADRCTGAGWLGADSQVPPLRSVCASVLQVEARAHASPTRCRAPPGPGSITNGWCFRSVPVPSPFRPLTQTWKRRTWRPRRSRRCRTKTPALTSRYAATRADQERGLISTTRLRPGRLLFPPRCVQSRRRPEALHFPASGGHLWHGLCTSAAYPRSRGRHLPR